MAKQTVRAGRTSRASLVRPTLEWELRCGHPKIAVAGVDEVGRGCLAGPVVAAAVGGLPTAVADGVSGVLVNGHDPRDWARTLGALVADPRRRSDLGLGAVRHASLFGWEATASATLDVYRAAMAARGTTDRVLSSAVGSLRS